MSEHKCPLCSSPMEIRTGFLGDFWGCVTFPTCSGTVSAKGTYTRAAQMAETEFDGKPLLPVTRITHGHYESKGKRFRICFRKHRKRALSHWEVYDRRVHEITHTGPSLVQFRFLLATEEDTLMTQKVSDESR